MHSKKVVLSQEPELGPSTSLVMPDVDQGSCRMRLVTRTPPSNMTKACHDPDLGVP